MADAAAQAETFKAQGNDFLKAKKFSEAIEAYSKAIELDPSKVVYFSNRSAAYLSNGDAEKALEDAEACIRVDSRWAKGYGRKGAALHALKRFDDAIDAYEAGLEIEPANETLKQGRDEVESVLMSSFGGMDGMGGMGGMGGMPGMPGMPQSPFTNMAGRLAVHPDPKFRTYLEDPTFVAKLKMLETNPNSLTSAMSDPRLLEAISALLNIPLSGRGGDAGDIPTPARPAPTASSPASSPSGGGGGGGGGGGSSSGSGSGASTSTASASPAEDDEDSDDEAAKEDEEEDAEVRAKKERKRAAVAKKEEGNAFYKKRQFADALRCYDEAIALDPEDVTYMLNRAAVFFEEEKWDECLAECEATLVRAREVRAPFALVAKAYARMGNVHFRQQDFARAIERFEQSLAESSSPDVTAKLKLARAEKKKADELAYLDPAKAEEAKERGNELFKAGKFREALDEYTEATKRNPRSAIYWTNRATARTKLMDWTKALEDLDQAVKVDPTYAKAHARRGAVQFFMKEFHRALDSYRKGLELDPESAECKDGIARTIAKINESAATGEVDEERRTKALADPEIQKILRDPMVMAAIQDLQTDPSGFAKLNSDPSMMAKIQKLIAAGVLGFGSGGGEEEPRGAGAARRGR